MSVAIHKNGGRTLKSHTYGRSPVTPGATATLNDVNRGNFDGVCVPTERVPADRCVTSARTWSRSAGGTAPSSGIAIMTSR